MPPILPMGARWKIFSSAGQFIDADEAGDQIARAGAADLSQAFRGALAPIRQMIAESQSAEDLQARLLAAYSDWPVSRVASLIEQALTAYSANRLSLR